MKHFKTKKNSSNGNGSHSNGSQTVLPFRSEKTTLSAISIPDSSDSISIADFTRDLESIMDAHVMESFQRGYRQATEDTTTRFSNKISTLEAQVRSLEAQNRAMKLQIRTDATVLRIYGHHVSPCSGSGDASCICGYTKILTNLQKAKT